LSALARCQEAWLLSIDERRTEALAILDDVIPVLRDLGARHVTIPANRTRAFIYEDSGTRRRDLLVQSLSIDRELGNVPFVSLDLVRFAVIHTREGSPKRAARLIARAVAVFNEIGLALESWMTREVDDATAAVRAQLDEAAFAAAWENGTKMSLADAVALALRQTANDVDADVRQS
jgi:hypothetical protein